MLVGIFRFIFVKLPKWLAELVTEWSPTFFKFIKVLCLTIFILSVSIVPGCYALNNADNLESGIECGLYLWSISAVLGALWGIKKIKLQGKGVIWTVKSIFSKGSEYNDTEA
jgi:hypothetical protein